MPFVYGGLNKFVVAVVVVAVVVVVAELSGYESIKGLVKTYA